MTLLDHIYGAWLRGDVGEGLSHCTDDVVYRDHGLGHERHGKHALEEWVRAGHARIKDWKVEFDSSFWRRPPLRGRGEDERHPVEEMAGKLPSDEPFFARYAIFGTITDGKVSRIMIYWNPREWVQTSGDRNLGSLPEEPYLTTSTMPPSSSMTTRLALSAAVLPGSRSHPVARGLGTTS